MDSHHIFYEEDVNDIKRNFIKKYIIEKSDLTKKFFNDFSKQNFVNFLHWIFIKLTNPETFGLKYREEDDEMVYLQEEDFRTVFDTVLNISVNDNNDINVYYNKLIDFINNLNKHQLLYLTNNLYSFDFTKEYQDLPEGEFINNDRIPDSDKNYSDDQNIFVNKHTFINTTYMIERYYNNPRYFENVVFGIVYKLKHKNGNVLDYDYIHDKNIVLSNYQLLKIFNIICNTKINKETKMYQILMSLSIKQLNFNGV